MANRGLAQSWHSHLVILLSLLTPFHRINQSNIPTTHSLVDKVCFDYLTPSTMSSDRSDGGVEGSETERSSSQASETGSEQFNHEESRLINAMEKAISKQKAAFACGGTVPIIATTDEGKEDRFDDVAGVITSPPVVLRWDLPSGMYILKNFLLYFATRSLSSPFPGSTRSLSYSPETARYWVQWSPKEKRRQRINHTQGNSQAHPPPRLCHVRRVQ